MGGQAGLLELSAGSVLRLDGTDWTVSAVEARQGRVLLDAGATSGGPASLRLRHAAVSLWLNSGVPATEVARRAGHGVAVLPKIYAHCIDGQANAANQRIADALGSQDDRQDPGEEGDGDSEPAA